MNKDLLIADSGSTKTDWVWDNQRVQTQGINPFHQDDDTIRHILQELCETLHPSPSTILFYGSGVRPELEEKMVRLLHEAFPQASHIEAHSDLLGAARALCDHEEGIACILGTGANSCYYDGHSIAQNTPALGYILGDEGSGANLGIRFLNALYKNQLGDAMKVEFEADRQLTMADVIQRVYKEPMANRWLASLSTFIHSHLNHPTVRQIVMESFREFIRKNLVAYGRNNLPVSAVGSIAFYYRNEWEEALRSEGFTIGRILRSPLDVFSPDGIIPAGE